MTRQVSIQLNVGSALRRLGKIYRSPADAIKDISPRCLVGHAPSTAAGLILSCGVGALARDLESLRPHSVLWGGHPSPCRLI